MTLYNVYSFFNSSINRNYINMENAEKYAEEVNGSIDKYDYSMYEIIRYDIPVYDMRFEDNPMVERINVPFDIIE